MDLKSPGGPGNSDFESEGDESFIRTGPAYQSLSRRAVHWHAGVQTESAVLRPAESVKLRVSHR